MFSTFVITKLSFYHKLTNKEVSLIFFVFKLAIQKNWGRIKTV